MMSDTTNENRRKDDARPARALTWTDPAPAAAHLGDAMTDIETMGTAPGSAILSIGAVTFGPAGLGDEFYAPISLASCTAFGLTIDPVTVAWWMKQSDAARAAAFRDDAEPLPVVLQQFTRWFELVEAERLWCQGANFDAPLLEAAYRACGMTPPWKFWNVRDTRTLYEQADVKVDRARGVHHNALDDARAQAEAAVVAMQRLQDARQQAIVSEKATCTCPSGDGSLRWPCPAHPPESASGSNGAVAAVRMTERKAMEIGERDGMARTGYVLQSDDGRACIVHQGAVRWLSNAELWNVVHPGAAPSLAAEEVHHHALCERKGHNPLCAGCDAEEVRDAKDAARLDWIDKQIAGKGSVWILPSGAEYQFVQLRHAGHTTNYPTAPGKVREAIDAAMSASQGKTEEAK